MNRAKDILIKPIKSQAANAIIKKVHYSGKVVNNSQLHLGVFYNGKLEGALQFGPSLDKRKLINLVEGTKWNEFIELNRMAFTDELPRNSESRAIGVAIRMIKKNYPHIKWIVSFSDGAQCGDGTIYRASGFVLTGIRKNTSIWSLPDGEKFNDIEWENTKTQKNIINRVSATSGSSMLKSNGGASMKGLKAPGAKPLDGYQLRYIYLIDKNLKNNLRCEVIPFSKIDDIGAGMYKGERVSIKERRTTRANSGDQSESGGSIPTSALHIKEAS